MAFKKTYYTVIAGNHKPQKQLLGFLKKDGNPKPEAQEIFTTVNKIQIPNYSVVWGKRVIKNPTEQQAKRIKNGSIAHSDPDYRGEIEYMVYGAEGGEAIEIRYLPNTKSHDKLYQDVVLKLKPREEDAVIEFDQGLNEYDYTVLGGFIEYLKVQARNGDSKSKNPDIIDYDFVEFSMAKKAKSEKEALGELQTALNLAFSTEGNDEQIAILGDIMGFDAQKLPELLFDDIMMFAKEEPKKFIGKLLKFKTDILELCENSTTLGLLDIGVEGMLSYFKNEKKVILVDKIESSYKGKQMFRYLTENILNPDIYKSVAELKAAYEKQISKG